MLSFNVSPRDGKRRIEGYNSKNGVDADVHDQILEKRRDMEPGDPGMSTIPGLLVVLLSLIAARRI